MRSDTTRLTAAQHVALAHIRDSVRERQTVARARVIDALGRACVDIAAYDAALTAIGDHARVVVHFHPDRPGATPRTTIEGILEDGVYRNQFETGRSSGGLLPFAGSPRDSWERALFGGAYQHHAVLPSERPKYGALELVRWSDGPIPRFGSCYFVLRPRVSARTSFTFAGSEDPRAPQRLGTIDNLDPVMAALFDEIEAGGFASPEWSPYRAPTLGVPHLTVARLLDLLSALAEPRPTPGQLPLGRLLDTQIEAQVHGPVTLSEDVELLVADPAFASTALGVALRQVGSRYGFPVQWHRGFRMRVEDVPVDFRGPIMRPLAERVADGDGMLDAAAIGAAEVSLHQCPERWRDLGSHGDVLQYLKQLWHVLVHCS